MEGTIAVHRVKDQFHHRHEFNIEHDFRRAIIAYNLVKAGILYLDEIRVGKNRLSTANEICVISTYTGARPQTLVKQGFGSVMKVLLYLLDR